ncbi:MAG: hypothetical protein Q8922_12845 [Bacteroidota bacterium]|nr:hypothetical protein [Bacteroidota bacterium]MDP4234480.1 hypothetical protein [Bacteroidota bacterium]MDP4244193.1 hypothetical protein [Bacteroidota bacterium]MDP4288813.1 hypothetical protein [Bacteroidota bacterium]
MKYKIVGVLLLVAALAPHAYAQNSYFWQQGTAPYVGSVYDILLDSAKQDVFAATDSGLYRLSNHLQTWTQLSTPFPGGRVARRLARSAGGVIIAALVDGSIAMSSDEGSSWAIKPCPIPDFQIQGDFAVSRNGTIAQISYSNTQSIRLLFITRSADSVGTVVALPLRVTPYCVAFYGDSTLLVGANGMVLTSDYGKTWSSIKFHQQRLPSSTTISSIACSKDGFACAVDYSGFYRSSDLVHWDSMQSPIDPWELSPDSWGLISIDSQNQVYLYGANRRGLFVSANQGDSWRTLPQYYGSNWEVPYTILRDRFGDLIANPGANQYVYPSILTPTDTAWRVPNFGLRNDGVGAIHQLGDSLLVVVTSTYSALSKDGGNNWFLSAKPNGDPFLISSKVWLTIHYGDLYESLDSGRSWELVPSFPGEGQQISSHRGYLFIRFAQGLYRSSDLGLSWDTIILAENPSCIVWAPDGMGFGLHSIYQSGTISTIDLLVTTDDGYSWKDLPSLPFILNEGTYMTIDSSGVMYVNGGDSLWRSSDRGETWHPIMTFSQDTNPPGCLVATSKALYLGTTKGVFASTDHGDSWQNVAPPVEVAGGLFYMESMMFDRQGYLWVTSAGLFRSRTPIMDQFSAVQTRPIASTEWSFNVENNRLRLTPPSASISLTLYAYNLLGVLAAEWQPAPGMLSAGTSEYDLSGLASGSYFFIARAESGSFGFRIGVEH